MNESINTPSEGTPAATGPHGAASPAPVVVDSRKPARGHGRILILIYGIFAVAATARSAVQLIRDANAAPFAYWLSALAAVVYIVATVAMAHNGRRMRRVAWGAVLTELGGVVSVGALSFVRPELFPDATVWSHFGEGYGYVPLILPIVGMIYLWSSDPSRIEKLAEGLPVRGAAR